MKVDVTVILKNYEGKDLTGADESPFTIRDAIVTALNNTQPNEVLPAEAKNKIYQLSGKLFGTDQVKLTLDDRSFIKERSGKIHNALVYGRLCEVLEGSAGQIGEIRGCAQKPAA